MFDEHRAGAFHQMGYTAMVGGHTNPYVGSARGRSVVFGTIICLSLFVTS
jgi:hypothetical protein